MRIGIIGGTGPLGKGLALRWALADHEVWIGSRDASRAAETATSLQQTVQEHNGSGQIQGTENAEAAAKSEVAVLAVPAAIDADMLQGLRPSLEGKILIDCTVGLDPKDITRVRDGQQATAQRLQQVLGTDVRVVAGFHTVAAANLMDLSRPLTDDTFFVGDDEEAKAQAIDLAKKIGLRVFDAGPLENGVTLERLTALLIGLNKRYRRRGIGLKLTGI